MLLLPLREPTETEIITEDFQCLNSYFFYPEADLFYCVKNIITLPSTDSIYDIIALFF